MAESRADILGYIRFDEASNLIKEDEGKWFVMVETPRLRSFSLGKDLTSQLTIR